jgi:hypothetical protein
MREDQFNKLIEYIDAAIANANAGSDGLSEYLNKINTRQSLHDSFFSDEEEDLLHLKKLQVSDQKKIIKEHVLFFNRLLDPDDLGWAVTEEVRNEAREFLGIPKVIIKKK